MSETKKRSALKRKTAIKRGAKPMKRGRVNPINRERRAQAFARNFGDEADYVRGLPCLVAVKLGRSFWSERGSCAGQMVAMHVVSRGAGGGRFDLVGACSHHHDEAHAIGVESFAAKYGLDLRAEADRIAASHAPPLGIRGLAQRFPSEISIRFDLVVLDDYERDALYGWVRRECEREAERRASERRQHIAHVHGWVGARDTWDGRGDRDRETLAAHVAKTIGLDADLAAQLLAAAEVPGV